MRLPFEQAVCVRRASAVRPSDFSCSSRATGLPGKTFDIAQTIDLEDMSRSGRES